MQKLLLAYCFVFYLTSFQSQVDYPLEIVIQRGHVKPVTCAAYSPNGKYIATGSSDNSIKLWNIKTGKEIRSFNEHTDLIKSVCFSKDGNRLLSVSADNKIVVQDIITAQVKNVFSFTEDRLVKAVFSSDETKILASNNEGKYWVIDVSSKQSKGPFKKSHKSIINQSWFGETNQTAIFHNYKEFHIFDLDSNKVIKQIEFDKAASYSFSPDGKFVTIGSTKLFAETFEIVSGKKLQTLVPDESLKCDGCNTVVQYSHDGKTIVTGAKTAGVVLWDSKKGVKLNTLEMNTKNRVRNLSFSSNDKFVTVTTDKAITVFNVKTGNKSFHIDIYWNSRFEATISPDEKTLVTPGKDNTTVIWNIITGRKQRILKGYLNHENDNGLGYSSDDWYAISILRYLNMKSSVAVSPTQPYFVRGGIDSSFVLVNWQTGKIEKTFQGHSKVVYTYSFSPDGKTFVTAGGDSFLILWDVETGKEIRRFKGHRDLIFDVKFNFSGTQLISGSWDGTMIIWDVISGKITQKIRFDNVAPYVVGFSPNDLYAVSADLGKQFKFWEVDAGKEFREIIGNTNIVGAFDFSPNGNTMVSACWDGKVKIWDVRTGMLTQKFDKHQGGATASIYGQNETQIISGGADRKIYIWDSNSKRIEHTLIGHTSAISDLNISMNGEVLISCSTDGVVKIWDLKTFKELYTYIQIDKENWLVTNPEGYFDGSAKAQKLVNYVSGLDVVPIGSLFNKFYTPNLLKRAMQGEQFDETGENINDQIKSSPVVNMTLIDNEKELATNGDTTYSLRNKNVSIKLSVSGEKSNDNMVRIYNNGKLVKNEAFTSEISFRGGDKNAKTFEIELNDGTNNLSAVVINSKDVESTPVKVKVDYDGEKALTDLYILVVGIDDYKNPSYHLNYAVNDAKSFLKSISNGSEKLFHTINEYVLLNENANKSQLIKTFEELTKEVGPEDVFLFYYAGHGVMHLNKDEKSEFYLVSYDITNLFGDESMMNEKAFSASELLEYSRKIAAEKQLFVLDACQSGAALNSFAQRGASREKTLAQLARNTGTFFLTASQDIEYANEAGDLKHGLFTYAILEALKGSVLAASVDGKITVNEIKGYVEERVPELSEKYHGTSQYPTSYSFGQDFPLILLKK